MRVQRQSPANAANDGPDLVAELRQLYRVCGIELESVLRIYNDTGLEAAAPKHDRGQDMRVLIQQTL